MSSAEPSPDAESMPAVEPTPEADPATQSPRQPPEELVGRAIVVVPVGPEHVDPLVSIIAEPSVARWWTDTPSRFRAGLLDPDPEETGFAILTAGDRKVIGYIQATQELEPGYRHAGIDLFIATAGQGHGFGPEAIRLVARWLIDARGHHRITIDPAAANARAIRAYEKVGFRRVGVLRQYERGLDGTWHDGLLMDLLAAELSPG
jgi:aminoglycoside 6'-N-acetyltransferase